MNGNKCENHGKYTFLEKSRKESGAHEFLEHGFHFTTSQREAIVRMVWVGL